MSVRITDTVTADGRKFQKMLKELAEREVRVGFQHGKATEEDGTDICDVAAWNELGTVHIPARPFLRMSVDDNASKIKSVVVKHFCNTLFDKYLSVTSFHWC